MNRMNSTSHLAERMAARLKNVTLPGTDSLFSNEPGEAQVPLEQTQPVQAQVVTEFLATPLDAGDYAPARIVAVETLEGAGMANFHGGRDRIGEEFRIVCQQVLQTMAVGDRSASQRNMIMVTSARPGEGKSFASLNLAGALAESSGRRVLLLDADTRERSLSRLLGYLNDPGLLDLDVSPSQLVRSVVIPSGLDNLSFLPVGGDVRNVASTALVTTANTVSLILQRIAHQFRDHILVIDAPPCLASSDPTAFAPTVGQIVLVVEAGRTRRKEVEGALDLLDACPNISLLLNKVHTQGGGSFGAYS
jgi:protein-tyrosine kinase